MSHILTFDFHTHINPKPEQIEEKKRLRNFPNQFAKNKLEIKFENMQFISG